MSSYHKSKLSDDDETFIRELKAELVTDLCSAGLLSPEESDTEGRDLYDEIEPQVARRVKIWDALEPEGDGKFSQEVICPNVLFMTHL